MTKPFEPMDQRHLINAIISSSDDVIYAKDLQGRMVYANPAALALIGKPAEAVLGRTDADFLDDKQAAAQVMQNDREVMDSGRAVEFEEQVPLPDGSIRVWASQKRPYRSPGGEVVGVLGISRDITARKAAEMALVEAEEQRQLALDAAGMGWWHYDPLTGIARYDNRYCAIFGVKGFERPNEEILTLLHPDDLPRVWAAVEAALAPDDPKPYSIDYRIRRPDGEERWIEARGLAVFSGSPRRATSFVGTVLDITERKHVEHALKDADRRKDEFLATLAHELRNPMAPVITAISLLKKSGDSPAVRERALAIMDRQTQHLVRLLDDLLEVSRVTRGKIELRPQSLDLRAVVRSCLDSLGEEIASAGLQAQAHICEESATVYADPARMKQVIDNILNNAIKYTHAGGDIRVELRVEDGDVVLEVRDTGAGIPQEMLSRVFDLFTQIDNTIGRSQRGLGIGLALVKELVTLQGGTVAARSSGIGLGTTFVVRLPLSADCPDTESAPRTDADPAPADPSKSQSSTRSATCRVMVVDDNRDAADTLSTALQHAGHRALAAYGGPAALTAAREFRPEAVLLDLGMPGMSGFEVANELRKSSPDLLIVALTGWGQPKDRIATSQAGFDHHLTKPVSLDVVLQLLSNGCMKHSSRQS